MNWNIPNQLTVGRVGLALCFFVLLATYEQATNWGRWLLNITFVLYIVAGITDILDGWLARRLDQTSAFGRMVDPIVDKVLVVGTFIMLTGNNYSHAACPPGTVSAFELSLPHWLTGGMFSGVQAWMVVAVLVRELVVSGVRGYSESQGHGFPATPWGKIKMFVQSVALCTVLYQMANVRLPAWAVITKISAVWVALVVTVFSGLMYIGRARKALRSDE